MEASSVVKRYNLAQPTEHDVIVSLSRLMDPEESRQLWLNVCRAAGVHSPLSLDQFETALTKLRERRGMASITASSMLVRLKSYRTLSMMNLK
jgi:hypothetical protein